MPPRPAAASSMAARHEASSVTSHSMTRRARPGLLGGVVQPLAAPGQQGDLVAALGEADPDAAPEPARRTHDHRSHVGSPSSSGDADVR